jgi:SAM-dependent methyltransferase
MHASSSTPYSFHEKIARRVHGDFHGNRPASIRKYLSRTPKFRFLIDSLSEWKRTDRVVELGCSLGYLTAYFILAGYKVLGVDISPTAIDKARSYFGDCFAVLDDRFLSQVNTFDVVCHLGTIGCVDDPVAFTRNALNLLKAGGRLLFNAPDVRSVKEMGALWNNATPPPDLVTLFEERFWVERVGDVADVSISYEPYSHHGNARKHLNRIVGRPYLEMKPELFHGSRDGERDTRPFFSKALDRLMVEFFSHLSRLGLIPRLRDEFGMFVTLTKK